MCTADEDQEEGDRVAHTKVDFQAENEQAFRVGDATSGVSCGSHIAEAQGEGGREA